MWDLDKRIPADELEDGRAYKLQSRNLLVGFWNARKGGFNGIREKFGDRYIFMEYFYGDTSGTALAYEPLDLWLPEDVPNEEYLGSFCQACDKPVKSLGRGEVERKGEMVEVLCIGWTHVADEDKVACEREGDYMSYGKGNKAMMDLLEPYDKVLNDERLARYAKYTVEG